MTNNLLSPLLHLFYPHVCTGCGSDLLDEDNLLCLDCLDGLPHTNFAMHPGNPVEKIFRGRIDILAAMSEFYFTKGGLVQKLIHELKYNGNKEIGHYLGNMMGRSMLNCERFSGLNEIIPLPLFIEKEFKRGYNQAAVLSSGISNILQLPVRNDIVSRKRYTETQTKKHRTERWENVEGSFAINNEDHCFNKHILLVDDVITTGATLEACGSSILGIDGTKLSIATLAWATK
jgi:ComF family protein